MSNNSMIKQDPTAKSKLATANDSGKVYYSYAEIHETITSLVPKLKEYDPDVIIAIGGGGFIPARMLRTELKVKILAVSLELYNDSTSSKNDNIKVVQWFDEASEVGQLVRENRVLVVDEVDDTRTTLQYCIEELIKRNAPSEIAVCVVHNKIKKKEGCLPPNVKYFAGADVPDRWNCYPWDAAAYGLNIYQHEELAKLKNESS